MLGHVPADASTIVADLEAGIGTLTRLGDSVVDVALVVVEATPKSLEVGRRAVEVAAAKGVSRIVVVANRVASDADRAVIADAFPSAEVFEVPDDRAIVEADREGVAPIDREPTSPAVQALTRLAEGLRG